MRRLSKGPVPDVLRERGAEWTDDYVAAIASGDTRKRPWAHEDIREALRLETHGKCAYCEALMEDVSFSHIEHITPRAADPSLVVSWENLTLCCERCNTYKGSYYDQTAPLLNPYVDDPKNHIAVIDGAVLPVPGSLLGRRTVERLKLHRSDLVEARSRRLQQLSPLLDAWENARGPDKEMLADQLRREAAPGAEYSAAVVSGLSLLGFPL